jgi:hypothetical protein
MYAMVYTRLDIDQVVQVVSQLWLILASSLDHNENIEYIIMG